MKKITLIIITLFFTIGSFAKDISMVADTTGPWTGAKQFGFNINQGSFSDNFQGSSVAASLGIGGFFNSNRDYKKDKIGWTNSLQMKYGVLSNKDKTEGASAITRKSIDVILFDSKFTKQISPKWSLAAMGNFITQFTNTYDNVPGATAGSFENVKRSGLFAPAFITESIGLEYKPNKFFNMTISPLALRQTIVSDENLYKIAGNEKNFGVTQGETFRNEVGIFQLMANFDKNLTKDLNLKFRYLAFASLKNFGDIDDRLDANLTAKVGKNVNVNLGLIAIYDNDQSGKLQLAQSLNFGFLFNL
jgi:Protein of unknown function (DUF3078)